MKNKKLFIMLMLTFILIQPVLDVVTALQLRNSDSSFTIGIILRMVYMLAMGIWIALEAIASKKARLYFTYLVGLAILLLANFSVNLPIKEPYHLIAEFTFYSKIIYVHILFFGFLLIFEDMKKKRSDLNKQLVKYLLIPSLIISAVFIIAQLTGTSFRNYTFNKEGYSGWFYAGNEIGAIMAILLPITALFATQRTKTLNESINWIPFVFLSLSLLALGTKVGYLSIIVVLLSILIGSLIMYFWKNKTEEKSKLKTNFITSFCLLIILAVATPFTPVFGNMFAHLDILGIQFSKDEYKMFSGGSSTIDSVKKNEDQAVTGNQLENLIFSSREQYKVDYQHQFSKATISQKTVGMGYGGNYHKTKDGEVKMIEMDFHDWFYAFGILGFAYIMLPFLWFSAQYIIRFVTSLKTNFDYYHILTGISLLMAISIAYSAGHVLTAPAASIYFTFLFASMIVSSEKKSKVIVG